MNSNEEDEENARPESDLFARFFHSLPDDLALPDDDTLRREAIEAEVEGFFGALSDHRVNWNELLTEREQIVRDTLVRLALHAFYKRQQWMFYGPDAQFRFVIAWAWALHALVRRSGDDHGSPPD